MSPQFSHDRHTDGNRPFSGYILIGTWLEEWFYRNGNDHWRRRRNADDCARRCFNDETKRKRLYVVIPGIFTILASAIILVFQNFLLVSISQVATAIAGSAIGLAVIGVTLGIVKQAGFNRQNGYNQAYNHAGLTVSTSLNNW